MDNPERYEQLLAFLGSHLPSPIDQHIDDDAVEFIGGDPVEVTVRLTPSSVIVSEFAGHWESPFTFVARPRRVGVLKWRRLPENPLWAALTALINGARESRRAKFERCHYCGRDTAPEWLHDTGVCQSCSDQHSGAIH